MSARDYKIILCYKNNEDGSPIFYNEKNAPTESLNPDTGKPYKAGDRVCTMLGIDSYEMILKHFPKSITKIKEAQSEHELVHHQVETIKEITEKPPGIKLPESKISLKEVEGKKEITVSGFNPLAYTCKTYKEETFTKEQLQAFISHPEVGISVKKYANKDLGKLQSV